MDEDEDGSITVSVDGISVSKRIETERFPTLAVELVISSERDELTTVRITEKIPADIPADDVGFHPNFGEGFWSLVDDDTIAFEREVAPETSYTTIYGFRDFPEERSGELMEDPVVDLMTEDGATAEIDSTDADDPEGASSGSGSMVRTVARELERGIAGPEERQMLREELRGDEDHRDPRIEELQQRVSDFEAYIDALETFLQKEGTTEEVFEEFRDDIKELEQELEGIYDEIDPVLEEAESLEDQLDELENEVTSADSRLDEFAEGLDDIEETVEDIESKIDEKDDMAEGISADVSGVDDRIDDVEDELSAIGSDIDELRSDIREDIRELEDDIEAFEALRDRLASVFGGSIDMGGAEPASEDNSENTDGGSEAEQTSDDSDPDEVSDSEDESEADMDESSEDDEADEE